MRTAVKLFMESKGIKSKDLLHLLSKGVIARMRAGDRVAEGSLEAADEVLESGGLIKFLHTLDRLRLICDSAGISIQASIEDWPADWPADFKQILLSKDDIFNN